MKHLNTYITEYIIKKKLDNPIDSSGYKYQPTNTSMQPVAILSPFTYTAYDNIKLTI